MLWDEEDRKSRVEQMAIPHEGLRKCTHDCPACLEIAFAIS